MQDIANHKFVSHASLWEITIKAALGKLRLLEPWGETLRQIERRVPGTVLPCTAAHLEKLCELPHHHRDPFDRMLVAQALADDLTLVSDDGVLDRYGARRLW